MPAHLLTRTCYSVILLWMLLSPLSGRAAGYSDSMAVPLIPLASLLQPFKIKPDFEHLPNPSGLTDSPTPPSDGIMILVLPQTAFPGTKHSELFPKLQADNDNQIELQPEVTENDGWHDQVKPSQTVNLPEIIKLSDSISLGVLSVTPSSSVVSSQQESSSNNPSTSLTPSPTQTPDNNDNNSEDSNPPDELAENDSSSDNQDAVIPVAMMFDGSGGSDPDDPYDGDSQTEQDPDDSENEFRELEKQVKQHRFNPIKKWQLVGKIIRFARHHKQYAKPSYQLMERLIRWESLVANIAVKLLFNEALAVSAFGDWRLATLRTIAVVSGDTVGSLIPWFFPEKAWLEFLSLSAGAGIIAGTDNAFAHWTNSTYALPWQSTEFVNFNLRLIVLINTSVWVSKYLYSDLLIGTLAKITYRNLVSLMIFDFIMKPIVLYASVGLAVGTVPFVCVVCAPNPIAPYHFPYPKYCPSVPWIAWHYIWPPDCTTTNVTATGMEDEESDGVCPVYVRFNNTEGNCTGVELYTPLDIK